MDNNNESGRKKEDNDTIPDILSLLDDACEALREPKTISGAPKMVREKVMNQLFREDGQSVTERYSKHYGCCNKQTYRPRTHRWQLSHDQCYDNCSRQVR
jgi:hypothetical protein